MVLKSLIFVFSFSYVFCYVLDYSSTKMLAINDLESYFGYSILLQRGNPPIAIVGAPKKNQHNKPTGALYKCDLTKLSCEIYKRLPIAMGIYVKNQNGDFLGMAIDGDDTTGGRFFTCAPRFVTSTPPNHYFTKGKCFKIGNSNNTNENGVSFSPMKSFSEVSSVFSIAYYDSAFAECGFDVKFVPSEQELLLGAPGKSLWNGALIQTKLRTGQSQQITLQPNYHEYHDNSYGYSLSWGKFIKNSPKIWYVIGGPRGANLKGHVAFFEKNLNQFKLKKQFFGEEFGSYFGSSILVVYKKNGGDDVLVGAPTYSGDTYDEGCVYYYRNKNNGDFYPVKKLFTGNVGSRFGTAMANLGDIDLDSFLDCAIAAPYEDSGIGAVYIYYGSSIGFNNDKTHRISPSNFELFIPKSVIRGFGMGISKGIDIDNNGHNDIVIGAHLTGQIFLIKAKTIIDSFGTLTTPLETLYTTTNNFTLETCLVFHSRNNRSISKSFTTQLLLEDDRVQSEKAINRDFTIVSDNPHCTNILVSLKKNIINTHPFTARFRYKVLNENLSFQESVLEIPISFRCGTDNICQVDLSITASVKNMDQIIVGFNNELNVDVTIHNTKEIAYESKIYITTPPEITLTNLRECDFINGSYVCLAAQLLKEKVSKSFKFDLVDLMANRTNLLIQFEVRSMGVENDDSDNKFEVNVPVILNNSPYIDSQSNPDSLFLNPTKDNLVITHQFLVGNQGPSPFNLSLVISVPQLAIDGEQIIKIRDIDGISNQISTGHWNTSLQQLNNMTNKDLSCFNQEISCTKILCGGGFLKKSNEAVVVSVKLVVDVKLLVKYAENKDKIVIASLAHLRNGTHTIYSIASTMIYGFSHLVPVWVYIVAALGGFLFLGLVIGILYKCNFFKRSYRDKLENEQEVHEPLHPGGGESVFQECPTESDEDEQK